MVRIFGEFLKIFEIAVKKCGSSGKYVPIQKWFYHWEHRRAAETLWKEKEEKEGKEESEKYPWREIHEMCEKTRESILKSLREFGFFSCACVILGVLRVFSGRNGTHFSDEP